MSRERIVAGLDVHKDTIYLCILNNDCKVLLEKVFSTLTPDLQSMREEMLEHGVTEAAMESTATYWISVWNTLYESMDLKLVNPYFIKQLPGRKSDVKDARWIAECLHKDLISGSFVPSPIVQDMRKFNRRIFDLQEDLTYNTNKLDALMQRCGFRLSNYVSQAKGKSYQKVMAMIVAGETRPNALIRCVHARIINKQGHDTILAALTADFHEADVEMIRQIKEMIELIQQHITKCKRHSLRCVKNTFQKSLNASRPSPQSKNAQPQQ